MTTYTLKRCESIHETAEGAAKCIGEPMVPVLDYPWLAYTRRFHEKDIDFFQMFSDTGESIRLIESIMGATPIYWIPRRLADRFADFIGAIAYCRDDGSVIAPTIIKPTLAVSQVTMGDDLHDCCLIIYAMEFPADHPEALAFRMQHRDAIRAAG